MTITDSKLMALLNRLTPRQREIVSESLKEGATMADDARAIVRWIKRKLKRRVRRSKRK